MSTHSREEDGEGRSGEQEKKEGVEQEQKELLTWLVRAAGSDRTAGGGIGGGGDADCLSTAVLGGSTFLLIFGGLLRFELLGMFTAFVVCLGLALQRRTNEPSNQAHFSHYIYHHGRQSHTTQTRFQ